MIEGILINGLVKAGLYALLATGFSLIFGVTRIINLAHTALYMLAAYGLYYFGQELGLSLGVSIALALVVTVIIGALTYKLFIERIREHHMTVLLITLAFAIIFEEAMAREFSRDAVTVPSFISGYWEVAGVKVLIQRWLALGTAFVVLIGLWLLLTKTKLGTAIRAAGQDAEVANLMGINVPRTFLITAGLAATLAAISGIVIGPTLGVVPHMWTDPLIMVMAIVVLGGLGSLKGSVIAAFILAYVEVIVCYSFPEHCYMSRAIALGAMILTLMVRPEGLFGTSFEEERL